MRLSGIVILLTLIVLFFECCKTKKLKHFELIESKQSGIHFQNLLEETPDWNILKYLHFYNGAGLAISDFNNDGFADLFFISNMGKNKLYLNNGGLKFTEHTEESGLNINAKWSYGVASVDINGDGLLDIYISVLGDYKGIVGENQLFVNQGVNENGVPMFKEMAEEFNLNLQGFSTQAVFLDYDLDGDLDMFQLNHSVHPNRTYGNGFKRNTIDKLSGDKLLRNDDGKFTDVTFGSGIYSSQIGYGLGVAVSDLNCDGYPDIYVGNDFFENDYLYINQKDGTFKEQISSGQNPLGHTTHSSMGNDIADFNNDALPDIVSLDMLPEDVFNYKTAGREHPYQVYDQYLKNGYQPQYTQNTFHLNRGNGFFSELGNFAGIAATEWSWTSLAADFDNDGWKDMYITNGILGATNDMDFIGFIADRERQDRINRGLRPEDMEWIKKIPPIHVSNHFFKNNGDLTFSDLTKEYGVEVLSYSNGGAYCDLDNDGDLEIVVNNVKANAFLFENHCREINPYANYLKTKFEGSRKNRFGIGAKVFIYTGGQVFFQENYTIRGYLSTMSSGSHFGLGEVENVDSAIVVWPGGAYQVIKNIKANTTLIFSESYAKGDFYKRDSNHTTIFTSPNRNVETDYIHKENSYYDFNRETLIPYMSTRQGPCVSITDIDNDGLDDLFVGGAKFQASELYLQNADGKLIKTQVFENEKKGEDTKSIFFDSDDDGDKDLLVICGGNEFARGVALNPRFYKNEEGILYLADAGDLTDLELNGSALAETDFDKDGDLDLFVGANIVPRKYGVTPQSFLYANDGTGNFKNVTKDLAPELSMAGNIYDACWADLNADGWDDLVVVGHWMPITIFYNNNGILDRKAEIENSSGWWNSVEKLDVNQDGKIDLVAGNFGLNTRLTASIEEPLRIYIDDFDNNGTSDPFITYFYHGTEMPLATKEELTIQLPHLNKKYLFYHDFARAKIIDLISAKQLKNAKKKQVETLAHCYFENNGDETFNPHKLPSIAQLSVINSMWINDFNHDTYPDLFLAGNSHGISTQLGRLDAGFGEVLINNKQNGFYVLDDSKRGKKLNGVVNDLAVFSAGNQTILVAATNSDSLQFLQLNEKFD